MKAIKSDKIFYTINGIILLFLIFIVAYPLYFIIVASFSDPSMVGTGQVWFWPKGFNLEGYKKILEYEMIWVGYRNTIIYTIFGTAINVAITVMAAYPLSRKDLVGRSFFMGLFTFTMYFGGGLIPSYLLVQKLGLVNNPLVLIILGSVSVWNLIITRTFFQSTIPDELFEAASIDGCGNGRFFFQMVLPLSKAIIAVMVVYYAVGHWNSFFNALIYINNRKYKPLQLVLRDILTSQQQLMQEMNQGMEKDMAENTMIAESIKYGIIIVSSLPIMTVYPFAQKYFVKGVMIGSLKG